MPLRCNRIPGSRGIRKGTRDPNRGQFTPISGAECTPSILKILVYTLENVHFQSSRLALKLGGVPLRRHRILRGRGIRKGTRAPNRGQFILISGSEALVHPSISKIMVHIY